MQFIEPDDLFLLRTARRAQDVERRRQEFKHQIDRPAEHGDGWDSLIMAYFIGQPRAVILYMRAVNALVKHCRAHNKKEREKAKVLIIRAIGRLIREGRLKRVKRRFVRVSGGEIPQTPIIPFGNLIPGTGRSRSHVASGSTESQTVVNPSIFV